MMHRKTQLLAAGLAALLVTGCRQDGIHVYDVPKEQPTSATATYIPKGWEEAPRGEMRINSFVVRQGSASQAEISVIPLPNMGGKLLDNVNRWRSSLGLKALTDEELAKAGQPVKVGSESGTLYEMNGDSTEKDEPTRILGAIVNLDGMGWYFKMMGGDKLVAGQKPEFLKFLAGYKFPPHDHSDHAGHNHGEDPHAGVATQAAPGVDESSPKQSWPVPTSWQQQAPGMMQDAKFAAAGGKAIITVSQAGGAMIPNIQRWRGQLQMASVGDSEAEKSASPLDLGGTKATLVDLTGPNQRMIVVVVPKGQMSVFYKLMGEPSAVAAEKDALIEFAKKVK